MRRAWLTLFALTALVVPALAHAGTAPFSYPTAYTLPAGRLEVSLFQSAGYGLTDRIEIGTHPLISLVHPYVYAKIGIKQTGLWDIATRHHVMYPTPLLRLGAREGTGGVLPGSSIVPSIVALNNEVLATHMTGNGHQLTVRAGLRNALILGDSDMPTIDFPVIYPRTLPYHGATIINAGVLYQVRPPTRIELRAGSEIFFALGGTAWAWESNLVVAYMPTDHVALRAGAKMVVGRYPFGVETRTLPLLDFTWAFF